MDILQNKIDFDDYIKKINLLILIILPCLFCRVKRCPLFETVKIKSSTIIGVKIELISLIQLVVPVFKSTE